MGGCEMGGWEIGGCMYVKLDEGLLHGLLLDVL